MSEALHGSLTFAHRFKSGALCTISIETCAMEHSGRTSYGTGAVISRAN
jgi:hypothetical protein